MTVIRTGLSKRAGCPVKPIKGREPEARAERANLIRERNGTRMPGPLALRAGPRLPKPRRLLPSPGPIRRVPSDIRKRAALDVQLVWLIAPYVLRGIYRFEQGVNAFGRGLAFVAGKYNRRGDFLRAHVFGPVGLRIHRLRLVCCAQCRHNGIFCRADGCGCGKWLLSRLRYKRWLGAFKCPRGHFGYGGLIPAIRWLRLWWPIASRLE